MKCTVEECDYSEDCIIRELINKEPPRKGCSYFKKKGKKNKKTVIQEVENE